MKNYDNDPAFKEFLAHEKEAAAKLQHERSREAAHAHAKPSNGKAVSHFVFYAGCAIIGALLAVGNTLILTAPWLEQAAKSDDFYWMLLRLALGGAFTFCLLGAFVRLCKWH